MQSPPVIPLRISPSLRVAALLVHVLPLTAAFAPEVPSWARFVVMAVVTVSGWSGQHHARRAWHERLCLKREGAPELERAECRDTVDVLPSSTDMGVLIALHLRQADGCVRRYALTRDGMDAEQWRGLKIWLRWRAKDAAPER